MFLFFNTKYKISAFNANRATPRQQHLLIAREQEIKQYLRIHSSAEHHLLFAPTTGFSLVKK